MVVAGKHSLTRLQADLTHVTFELLDHGASIQQLVAAHTAQAAAAPFAARLHLRLAASEFGFLLAKQSKFALPSTAASLTVSKFLTQYAELFASHKLVQLTTA